MVWDSHVWACIVGLLRDLVRGFWRCNHQLSRYQRYNAIWISFTYSIRTSTKPIRGTCLLGTCRYRETTIALGSGGVCTPASQRSAQFQECQTKSRKRLIDPTVTINVQHFKFQSSIIHHRHEPVDERYATFLSNPFRILFLPGCLCVHAFCLYV